MWKEFNVIFEFKVYNNSTPKVLFKDNPLLFLTTQKFLVDNVVFPYRNLWTVDEDLDVSNCN